MNLRTCCIAVLMTAVGLVASHDARGEHRQVRIGSKNFTESVILGEMLTHLARSAGGEATHQAELGGTQILWKALVAGDIDAYVEYTGTLSHQIFAGEELRTEAEIRAAVEKHGLCMSRRLTFNNTYALAMTKQRAQELKIRTISDLSAHPELDFGFSDEFLERKDGWPGLQRTYKLPQRGVRGMEHNLTYRGVKQGAIDVVDAYTTDAEIPYYHLRVLEDDRGYFPAYEAVILYRADLPPQVVAALGKLEGKIDNRRMAELNAQAKLDRVSEKVVAAGFLRDQIDSSIATPDVEAAQFWRRTLRLLKNTWEHLFLVGVSLVGAIVVAVPVGIAAYKLPKFGETILGIVGVIQTLPSLALLVFMIPLFGLGAWPAIVALFLYSLLPIVRNTYTGLNEIPPSLRESAQTLGLPAMARLWLVELPMASRSILAGIKTAAVINVGTATIGALIGAGGYGQPILTGIRLDDVALILQGAIPAAILALLVQRAFGKIEQCLVPNGLQSGD